MAKHFCMIRKSPPLSSEIGRRGEFHVAMLILIAMSSSIPTYWEIVAGQTLRSIASKPVIDFSVLYLWMESERVWDDGKDGSFANLIFTESEEMNRKNEFCLMVIDDQSPTKYSIWECSERAPWYRFIQRWERKSVRKRSRWVEWNGS